MGVKGIENYKLFSEIRGEQEMWGLSKIGAKREKRPREPEREKKEGDKREEREKIRYQDFKNQQRFSSRAEDLSCKQKTTQRNGQSRGLLRAPCSFSSPFARTDENE